MRRDDGLAHGLERGVALGALAFRYHDVRALDADRFQRGLSGGEMVLGHGGVGDDRALGARPQRRDALAERSNQPAADDDIVGARPQRDRYHNRLGKLSLAQRRGHGLPSAPAAMPSGFCSRAMISSTMVSCGSSRDCTTMSESA